MDSPVSMQMSYNYETASQELYRFFLAQVGKLRHQMEMMSQAVWKSYSISIGNPLFLRISSREDY